MRQLAIVLSVAAVVVGLVPGIAAGTPSSGVSGTVFLRTIVGGTEYTLREVTIQPGGFTGWHFHDGVLRAYVRAGTLTHHKSDCSIDGVYGAGRIFSEPAGPDNVHIGRNLGSTPVVLEVLYALPVGSPLSQDAPDPGCGF